jgi:4-amino-4-deoxy-L-arabinose transferase-like glycosyltransferase
MDTMDNLAEDAGRFWHNPWFHRALICIIFAGALIPVIPLAEFSGGMENFNVATAVESQRNGHWLMPYLGLLPRAAKPPLVHWITAVGISLFPNSLAWGSRGPSIFISCAMLVAVYELGRTLEDWLLGLIGAFICGTTILFLKFAWQASYDLHLALWVTVANWQLARATFHQRRWSGCLLAGVAIGLALMCKGPVALLQTIFPWAAFLAWRRWRWKSHTRGAAAWTGPILCAVGLMLLIALPWTLYAVWVNRHMLGLIFNEVTLAGEAGYDTRVRWHAYIIFFPLMLPWLIWFLSGFVDAWRDGSRAPQRWLLILWLVLPILVMTFFPERRDRYLLPMAAAAALLAAHGVLRDVPRWGAGNSFQRSLAGLHAVIIAVMAVGLPILGLVSLTTVDERPWYTPAEAAAAVVAALVILTAGLLLYRKGRFGFVAGTVALMLVTNIVFMEGYKDSSSGRSKGRLLAAKILDAYPDAQVYNAAPQLRIMLPLELLIYLDRDVPQLPHPDSLPPSNRAQVLIYPTADRLGKIPPPPVPPPGFELFLRYKINAADYDVFVRPGA